MNKAEMLELRLDGLSYGAIAREAGISRQRVQQLLSPPKAVRIKVVQQYEGRCDGCRIRVGDSGHVHHIGTTNGDDYNDIDNLQLLCVSCHRQSHPGKTHSTTPGAKPSVPKTFNLPVELAKRFEERAARLGPYEQATLIIQFIEEGLNRREK